MEQYLTDAIKALSTHDFKELEEKLLYQTKMLDAKAYNDALHTVEKHLNQLYDKMRLLEEVDGYLKTSIEEQVITMSTECETLLKEIEMSRDNLKTYSYKRISVPFENRGNGIDRDHSVLTPMHYIDSSLTLHSTVEKDIMPLKVTRQAYSICYNQNVNELIKGLPYRVCYFLDEPVSGGVVENLTFSFGSPKTINRLMLQTSNSEAKHFTALNHNQTISLDTFVFPQGLTLDSLSFDLVCDKFSQKKYKCDAMRMESNAFDKIVQNEINLTLNQKGFTQAEIDKILGIEKYKADYQTYLKKLESWKERRKAAANQNRENGYSDDVPSIEIIKDPLGINGTGSNEETNHSIPADKYVTKTYGFIAGQKDIEQLHYNLLNSIYPSYEYYRLHING